MSDLVEDSSIPEKRADGFNFNRRSFFWFFLISILFSFSSCQQKNTSNGLNDGKMSKISDRYSKDFQSNPENALQQAKLSNIPIPVGYRLVESDLTDELASFCYEGSLTVQQVADFYKQNMERLGWDISDLSTEQEGLLFCCKPRKVCAASIREEGRKKNAKIYLFLKDKENGVGGEVMDINAKQIPLS